MMFHGASFWGKIRKGEDRALLQVLEVGTAMERSSPKTSTFQWSAFSGYLQTKENDFGTHCHRERSMKLERDGINKARRTWLDVICYRSQTEAKWAVFFLHMDIEFEYEEEHFDLEGLWYRPDFWLPKQNCWIEVKGPFPTQKEREKARRLAAQTGKNVYISFGDIPEPNVEDESFNTLSSLVFFPDGREDESFWWCECPHCGTVGLQSEGRAACLPCGCLGGPGSPSDRANCYYSPRLLRAYLAGEKQTLIDNRKSAMFYLKGDNG